MREVKRLREVETNDRWLSRAQVLIEAMGPTVPSEARLRRVRKALDEPLARKRRAPLLRGAWIVASLLCLGASAFAFNGLWAPPVERLAPAPPSLPSTSPSPALRTMAKPAPETEPPLASPPESASVPVSSPPVRRPPSAPASVAPSDVARVHEATKALRGEGNPERALRILEGGQKPVGGPLAEEALALRIEAAIASSDDRAKPLARSYLQRYPEGRYRELARRALAAP